MPFGEPDSTGRLNPRDIIDHLIMVWPTDYIPHAPSKFSRPDKPSDAVVVDIVDLDEADPMSGKPGCLYQGVWWRPAKLIQSLKRKIGTQDPILAWMSQGTASPGVNAPFILVSATQDAAAVKRAEDWLALHPDFVPTELGSAPKYPTMDQSSVPEPEPAQDLQVSRTVSQLERLAQMARDGANRLPPPPPERIPY